ncbi:3'-5' exonuclease [Shewanella electrodiphila]|uniref:3'-5' exonuclease n=1 Tax=Shewanella electrodiphila TaxID=934143 RepID=A0ABT0KS42_9GAMM|nr:3'-5' exonuclease [Shewanella electrodiphila]MCL1046682.1 3'-5' exonuclease [Shewanella electrodiphila]
MALLDYFHPLSVLKRQRESFLIKDSSMQSLLKPTKAELPELKALCKDLTYVVLDIETTGFDPVDDDILSMGWVVINNQQIDLANCQHLYIKNCDKVKPESAVINHITPQMLDNGISLHEAMNYFFTQLGDRVLVAHGSVIESGFINYYAKKYWQLPTLPLLWLDTLCLEKHFATAIDHYSDVDLTLAGTRKRYGLPEYNSHNALVDALGAAELLLAQQKRLSRGSRDSFARLYRLSQKK